MLNKVPTHYSYFAHFGVSEHEGHGLQCFCALSMNRGRSLPSPKGLINRQGISLIFMHNEEVYFGNIRSVFSKFYLTEDDVSIPCSPFHITPLQKKRSSGNSTWIQKYNSKLKIQNYLVCSEGDAKSEDSDFTPLFFKYDGISIVLNIDRFINSGNP